MQRAVPSYLGVVLTMAAVVAAWLAWRGDLTALLDLSFEGKYQPSLTRQDTAVSSKPAALAPNRQNDRLVLVTESGRHPVTLEVADTEEKKQVGLMFRTELADGHGMLFPYDRPHEITMWMKNTYISLDMVFIGADGGVVRVARSTEPMSEDIISSDLPALGVLELKAGAAERYRITAGKSRVEHPHFGNATMP